MKYIIIYLFIIDPKLLKSLGAKILNKENLCLEWSRCGLEN